MYTDVTFKSGTPLGTRMVLYDVQEEDSDWSQQSSFEDDDEDEKKPEAKGETSKVATCTLLQHAMQYNYCYILMQEVTYSEVQFKNS